MIENWGVVLWVLLPFPAPDLLRALLGREFVNTVLDYRRKRWRGTLI